MTAFLMINKYMQSIQEVFQRIEGQKKKLKELKSVFTDALKTSLEYQEVLDKQKSLREKKIQIERTLRDQFASELTKIEDLKIDIASDEEVLSDLALSQLMNGETVQVKDQHENEYEPVFKVSFKKVK